MKSINIDLVNEIDSSNDSEAIKELAKEILKKINAGNSDDKIKNDLDTELYKIIHNQALNNNEKDGDSEWF